jgi:hypothetical protein
MKDSIRFAGYSRRPDGVMRFRTARNQARIDQLISFGEEVYMIQIAPVSSKSAAAKELLRLDHARGVAELEAFYTAQVRCENPFKQPKKSGTVRVESESKTAPKLAAGAFDWETPMPAKEARKIRAEFNRKLRAAYEAN